MPACFWLVVESKTSIGGHLRLRCIFLNYIFVDKLNSQNDGAVTPRTFQPSCMSSPIYNPPRTPTSIRLLYIFRKRWPPKVNAPPDLSIFWCELKIKNSSQTREPAVACTNPAPGACNGPMRRCGAKIWGRRCPTHEERGQSCWGVGWRLILLVVVLCCVVLCCVLFVASNFWFFATTPFWS